MNGYIEISNDDSEFLKAIFSKCPALEKEDGPPYLKQNTVATFYRVRHVINEALKALENMDDEYPQTGTPQQIQYEMMMAAILLWDSKGLQPIEVNDWRRTTAIEIIQDMFQNDDNCKESQQNRDEYDIHEISGTIRSPASQPPPPKHFDASANTPHVPAKRLPIRQKPSSRPPVNFLTLKLQAIRIVQDYRSLQLPPFFSHEPFKQYRLKNFHGKFGLEEDFYTRNKPGHIQQILDDLKSFKNTPPTFWKEKEFHVKVLEHILTRRKKQQTGGGVPECGVFAAAGMLVVALAALLPRPQ